MTISPRRQEFVWSCGAAALAAASNAPAIGRHVSERSAYILCGTTGEGTAERGIIAGAELLGLDVSVIDQGDQSAALLDLKRHLRRGAAVLAVDNWTHWIAVVSAAASDSTNVIDPENGREREMTDAELVVRWRFIGAERRFYAVLLRRRRR